MVQEQTDWWLQGEKVVGREEILMTSSARDGSLTSWYRRGTSLVCSFISQGNTKRLSPLLLSNLPEEFYAVCTDRLCVCVCVWNCEETTCAVENNAPFKQAEQVLIQGRYLSVYRDTNAPLFTAEPFHVGVIYGGFKPLRSFVLTDRSSWIFHVSRLSSRSIPLALKLADVWTDTLQVPKLSSCRN